MNNSALALRPRALIRVDARELAAGFADLGVFLPITLGLIAVCGLQATAVFGVAGLAYLATALYFRVPVPVQPLKALGATAIALGLDAAQVAAGGLIVGAAMGLLAATGAAGWLGRRFPTALVRGVQASVGLLLTKAAYELTARGGWKGGVKFDPLAAAAIAAGSLALVILLRGSRHLPAVASVLLLGAAATLLAGGKLPALALGPELSLPSLPAAGDLWFALGTLAVAQIPLTFANSVCATVDAEATYYGARAARVNHRRLCLSLCGWNLLAGVFHGAPICHGSGGVTAHRALGARGPLATATVGVAFLMLALTFGTALPQMARLIAPAALAGLLAFVAYEHLLLARRLERRHEQLVAALTGVVSLLTGNLAIGLGAGAVALFASKSLRPLVHRRRGHPAANR